MVSGASPHGNTFIGYGINPYGQTEAWIATVPEPGSVMMLVLAEAGVLMRRRRLGR